MRAAAERVGMGARAMGLRLECGLGGLWSWGGRGGARVRGAHRAGGGRAPAAGPSGMGAGGVTDDRSASAQVSDMRPGPVDNFPAIWAECGTVAAGAVRQEGSAVDATQLTGYRLRPAPGQAEARWVGTRLRDGARVHVVTVAAAERGGRRAAVGVEVPGLVTLGAIEPIEGGLALVYEDPPAHDLDDLERVRGPLDAGEISGLVGQVALVLEALADLGLVHHGVARGCLGLRSDGTVAVSEFAVHDPVARSVAPGSHVPPGGGNVASVDPGASAPTAGAPGGRDLAPVDPGAPAPTGNPEFGAWPGGAGPARQVHGPALIRLARDLAGRPGTSAGVAGLGLDPVDPGLRALDDVLASMEAAAGSGSSPAPGEVARALAATVAPSDIEVPDTWSRLDGDLAARLRALATGRPESADLEGAARPGGGRRPRARESRPGEPGREPAVDDRVLRDRAARDRAVRGRGGDAGLAGRGQGGGASAGRERGVVGSRYRRRGAGQTGRRSPEPVGSGRARSSRRADGAAAVEPTGAASRLGALRERIRDRWIGEDIDLSVDYVPPRTQAPTGGGSPDRGARGRGRGRGSGSARPGRLPGRAGSAGRTTRHPRRGPRLAGLGAGRASLGAQQTSLRGVGARASVRRTWAWLGARPVRYVPVMVLVLTVAFVLAASVARPGQPSSVAATPSASPAAPAPSSPPADVEPEGPATVVTPIADPTGPLTDPDAVATELSRLRSRAWSDLDLTVLPILDAPGSAALRQDRDALRRARTSGLRYEGLRFTVRRAVGRAESDDVVHLDAVIDASAFTVTDATGARTDVPAREGTRVSFELAWSGERWQVAAVT